MPTGNTRLLDCLRRLINKFFFNQDKTSALLSNNSTLGDNVTLTTTNNEEQVPNDPTYANIWLSIIKTMVMFVGEMDYPNLIFTHWLGYVIFSLFVFLVMIVLMNVLNGLAVRDISRIMEEMDTYHNISIIDTLASTFFLKLVAQEVILFPNIKPQRQTFLKIPIMGQKVNNIGNNFLEWQPAASPLQRTSKRP